MMDNRESYYFSLAKKLSNRLSKPSATIVAVAFLLIWAVVALAIDMPMAVYLSVNIAVSGLTLLMVLLVQNAHGQDIRALQAQLEELATERQRLTQAPTTDPLTEAELQDIRDLLQRPKNDETKRRPDRDKRPSLF